MVRYVFCFLLATISHYLQSFKPEMRNKFYDLQKSKPQKSHFYEFWTYENFSSKGILHQKSELCNQQFLLHKSKSKKTKRGEPIIERSTASIYTEQSISRRIKILDVM